MTDDNELIYARTSTDTHNIMHYRYLLVRSKISSGPGKMNAARLPSSVGIVHTTVYNKNTKLTRKHTLRYVRTIRTIIHLTINITLYDGLRTGIYYYVLLLYEHARIVETMAAVTIVYGCTHRCSYYLYTSYVINRDRDLRVPPDRRAAVRFIIL